MGKLAALIGQSHLVLWFLCINYWLLNNYSYLIEIIKKGFFHLKTVLDSSE
jgi:hypothetical protein